MNANPLSPLVTTVIILTSVLLPVVLWAGIDYLAKLQFDRRVARRVSIGTAVALFGWLFIALLLAIDSFFAITGDGLPPVALAGGWLVFLLAAVFGIPQFRQLVRAVPIEWLAAVQTTRVIGYSFIIARDQGLIPATFGTPAGWGDLLTGLLAPLVAYALVAKVSQARSLALAWNTFGLADLIVAASLGILTAPGAIQTVATDFVYNDAVQIGEFPLVLVPATLVPLVFVAHIISFYKLLSEPVPARRSSLLSGADA